MSTPSTLTLPDSVSPRTISTDRGDFASHEASPAAPRGLVLLVPGFTGSKEDFTPVLPLLAERGWHAVAYDQRGQFETPGAAGDDYALEAFAADAQAVADAVGTALPRHLVGHSFGGLVAQAVVAAYADRWTSVTYLCSGPGAFTTGSQLGPLRAAINLLERSGTEAFFDAKQAHAARSGVAPLPAPIEAHLRQRYALSGAASMAAIARHLCEAPDVSKEVAAAGLPSAVVRGVDDDAWPHAAQQSLADALGVPVTVIAEAAHSPAVENPTETAKVLGAFFDRTSAALG